MAILFFNEPELICLYTIKCCQVLSFIIHTQLTDFKFCYLTLIILILIKIPNEILNRSIWSIDGTLTGTITLGQNGPKSNGNNEVLHSLQTPKQEPYHQMLFNIIPRTLKGFKYCYKTLIIQFDINHLFSHS